MRRIKLALIAFGLLLRTLCTPDIADAGVASEAVEQTTKIVLRQFGREVAEEGVEVFAKRLTKFASQYGDDGVKAVQKAGPSAMKAVTEAGEFGAESCKLLSRYGDDALAAASDPQMLKLIKHFGDDGAEVVVKHGRVAAPVCEKLGEAGAKAMQRLSPQNGRRLGMLLDDGTLAKLGPTDKVLNLLQKSGDKAMEFIWKNKGSLAIATVALAFWSQPEAFIEGGKDLMTPPVEAISHEIAKSTATGTSWVVVIGLSLLAVFIASELYLPFKLLCSSFSRALHRNSSNPRKEKP